MDIRSRHSNSNFANSSLLTFIARTNFTKTINLWWMGSLWCELLCKLSIYTLKSDKCIMVKVTCLAKFEFKYLQLLFIYFNSKIAKTATSNAGRAYIRTHPEKTCQRFLTLHSPICIFLIKCSKFNCHHPEYFLIYFFWWYHNIHFKMVYSSPKKAISRISISSVFTYTQPLRVSYKRVLCITHSVRLQKMMRVVL